MRGIWRFHIVYFLLALLLFVTEVLIALYMHDRFVRPYFGDFLVVILMYCFVRAFLKLPVLETAICVLLFSYFIEILQYLNLLDTLGLRSSAFARTVLGSSFEWIDLLAYTLGIAAVIFVEKKIVGRKKKAI